MLTVAQASTALQQSLDQWNNIPTSFIDMKIVGTVPNAGLVGFDMVNELSFRTAAGFGAIASSPSTALIADSTFANGDDIDGDGDADVSSAITVTTDVDADGDMEFPAGNYKAGTILDNDVQFNTKTTNGLRFTVGDAALDTTTRSVDFNTVATHEFGHSHGLSHSLENQKSDTNGDSATMFPFIDTGDPASELQQRSLGSDDIAWSSFIYPEGTRELRPGRDQEGRHPLQMGVRRDRGERSARRPQPANRRGQRVCREQADRPRRLERLLGDHAGFVQSADRRPERPQRRPSIFSMASTESPSRSASTASASNPSTASPRRQET